LNSNSENSRTLHSLDDLISALSEGERTTFNDIIRSIKIPSSAFEAYCSWSKDLYTRNCIINTEKFELILLCWEPGQITPIHDHGGEECWVKVVQGEFRETIYKVDAVGKLDTIDSIVSTTGNITYMIDFMGFHSLENRSNTRSMSLHLYAKPIRTCNAFDAALGKFVPRSMSYNTTATSYKI
jgi:cysteine dioxygenase